MLNFKADFIRKLSKNVLLLLASRPAQTPPPSFCPQKNQQCTTIPPAGCTNTNTNTNNLFPPIPSDTIKFIYDKYDNKY